MKTINSIKDFVPYFRKHQNRFLCMGSPPEPLVPLNAIMPL